MTPQNMAAWKRATNGKVECACFYIENNMLKNVVVLV